MTKHHKMSSSMTEINFHTISEADGVQLKFKSWKFKPKVRATREESTHVSFLGSGDLLVVFRIYGNMAY